MLQFQILFVKKATEQHSTFLIGRPDLHFLAYLFEFQAYKQASRNLPQGVII